ncbi:MAG: hypothetical protein AAF221_10830 [Pseudomonadota bacterium]
MARTGRIALIALGCFAVLLAGLYAYLRWDNYNALRDLIATRVENATGQQLSFNGPVSLEMGADSFLNFRDVVLTNPDWQMIRSTITVDEGRIGLDVPNVIAGGIGTVVQLNTVKVELDRPQQAADMPPAPPPGTVLSAPSAPALPKFDELRAQRLIVIARNILGTRELQLENLKVAPETEQRTRMDASALGGSDVNVTVLTDEIEGGRAWTLSMKSPRSELDMVVEASAGRKLTLRGMADAKQLDVADLLSLLPHEAAAALEETQKPFFDQAKALPVGWLQLIKANLDVRLANVVAGAARFDLVRLEGRADNGWISLAPLDVKGRVGGLKGFAVLNAGSLPASIDVSVTADGFAPFVETLSAVDGYVRLAGTADDFVDVRRPSGDVAIFTSDFAVGTLAGLPLLRQILPYLGDVSGSDETARCAVLRGPVQSGRLRPLSGQLYSNMGRVALRGSAGLFGGAVDIDAAVQPGEGEVQFVNAIGSLREPAVAPDTKKTPWLNFDLPQDKVCALLRQQFEMSLSGR